MAGKEAKIATVIIKVDLECSCCSKKIKWALCKLQKRFKIDSIVFDEKKNTVTVSGPFNPDCFIKKICCLAYKVIKDIEIKPDPPPKEKPKPPPPPPEVDVKISITTCCCQPCPCYQPHQGCYRCCSCGHVSSAQPSTQQCPKPCPPAVPPAMPQQCPKPCPPAVPPAMPQQCPKPCPQPCPPPGCQPPQFDGCPQQCPKPCRPAVPQQCPKPCGQPYPQPCLLPCCQPCPQQSQCGGYPCYKIVCEEEPSYGCSIM